MKQYFYFYFDKHNHLHCINSYNGHLHRLTSGAALKKLDFVDYLDYKKIILNNDKLKLVNDDNNVTIDGINKFYKLRYDTNIKRTHYKLNKHIRFRIVKNNDFKLNVDKLTIFTNEYRKRLALKAGVITLISASFIATAIYAHKELNNDVSVDHIEYDASLLDSPIRDYSINYYYEPSTFELRNANYEAFDGYTSETSASYDAYFDIVTSQATRWGIDPHLVMAMLIQESHGQGKNIMQISYSSWVGGKIKLYDFNENKYVEILFTNDKSRENDNTICISGEDMQDPEKNICMACAILRHSIDRMNNHIIAGLQNYNFGDGNMDSVINHATADLNITKEELLADQDNLDFTNYVNYASGGDKHYINNVLKYIKDVDDLYYLDINEYGNIQEYRYNINSKVKK